MANPAGASSDYARDTYDDVAGSMLSEYMLIFLKRNQAILVQNDNILNPNV